MCLPWEAFPTREPLAQMAPIRRADAILPLTAVAQFDDALVGQELWPEPLVHDDEGGACPPAPLRPVSVADVHTRFPGREDEDTGAQNPLLVDKEPELVMAARPCPVLVVLCIGSEPVEGAEHAKALADCCDAPARQEHLVHQDLTRQELLLGPASVEELDEGLYAAVQPTKLEGAPEPFVLLTLHVGCSRLDLHPLHHGTLGS